MCMLRMCEICFVNQYTYMYYKHEISDICAVTVTFRQEQQQYSSVFFPVNYVNDCCYTQYTCSFKDCGKGGIQNHTK